MPLKLIKNAFIYTVGSIIPQAVGFILLPVYTRFLSPADYGIIESMTVLSSVLTVVFTLCIERSITRFYFDFKTEKEQKDFFGTIVLASFLNSVFILALIFIFSNFIGRLYKSITFYPFYAYAVVTCFFSIFSSIPRLYLQIREKALEYVILTLVQLLFSTLLILWYVCFLKTGAIGQLKAQLISSVMLLPICILIIVKIINFRISLGILKNVIVYSLPFVPILLINWVLTMSNRIFIERYFNLNDVGIYSLAYRLSSVILIISTGFECAYCPYFFKLANEPDQQKNKAILERINNNYALFLIFLITSLALLSKEIINFFLDKRFVDVYPVVRIMAFSNLFVVLNSISGWSLLQNKKSKNYMFLILAIGAINIMLNFILIPKYSLYGAAWASVITYLIGFLVQYQYSKKFFYIPINLITLFSYFFFAIATVILYHFIFDKWLCFALISKILLLTIVFYLLIKKITINRDLLKLNEWGFAWKM